MPEASELVISASPCKSIRPAALLLKTVPLIKSSVLLPSKINLPVLFTIVLSIVAVVPLLTITAASEPIPAVLVSRLRLAALMVIPPRKLSRTAPLLEPVPATRLTLPVAVMLIISAKTSAVSLSSAEPVTLTSLPAMMLTIPL